MIQLPKKSCLAHTHTHTFFPILITIRALKRGNRDEKAKFTFLSGFMLQAFTLDGGTEGKGKGGRK